MMKIILLCFSKLAILLKFKAKLVELLLNPKLEWWLSAYWVITQILIFYHSGIKTSVDSTLYIEKGNGFLPAFHVQDPHDFWYAGYIFILSLVFSLSKNLVGIIIIQVLFSGLALIALYQSVLIISRNRSTAFISSFLYVFWFEIHTWNFFIYTESLFISFSIISFCLLIRAKKLWQYILTAIFILLTCLIRPTGSSFLVSISIFFILRSRAPSKLKWFVATAVLFLIVLLINKMLESFELISSYAKAEIIYPDVPIFVKKSESLHLPKEGLPPLLGLAEFAFYNPAFFFKLCLVKLMLFFAHVKPYFSVIHNICIAAGLYPLYVFAIKASRQSKNISLPVLGFLWSYIGLQGLTVMLTTENWDGRFLLPVLPYVFILSGIGINQFLNQGVERDKIS